jgi:hypothetical protein
MLPATKKTTGSVDGALATHAAPFDAPGPVDRDKKPTDKLARDAAIQAGNLSPGNTRSDHPAEQLEPLTLRPDQGVDVMNDIGERALGSSCHG